jgi:hypothetical protein
MHSLYQALWALPASRGSRGARWDFDIISQWTDPTEADQQVRSTRAFWSEIEPYASGGIHVNHIADDEPGRVQAAFGPNYVDLLAGEPIRVELENRCEPDIHAPPARRDAGELAVLRTGHPHLEEHGVIGMMERPGLSIPVREGPDKPSQEIMHRLGAMDAARTWVVTTGGRSLSSSIP